MADTDDQAEEVIFGAAVARLGPPRARRAERPQDLKQAFRRLHPPAFPALRSYLSPILDALVDAIGPFQTLSTPPALEAFHTDLL